MSTTSDIVTLLTTLGGGGAGLAYFRERRKDRASSEVAEQTVAVQVDDAKLSVTDKTLDFAEKAFASERASFERRIAVLDAEAVRKDATIEAQRVEIERKDATIQTMQARLEHLQQELDVFRHDLDNALTGEHDNNALAQATGDN